MNTATETRRKWRILALFVAACMVLSVCSVQTIYAETKAPSVTIKDTKSAKAGELKVSWKKSKKAAGYQVVVAKDKKFKKGKKVKSVKKKSTSVTFKKLSKGTKYYAKVRAYRMVNGKKSYGKYSKVKSVKTKGKKATPLYKKVEGKSYYSKLKSQQEFVSVKFGKVANGKVKLKITMAIYQTDYGVWSNNMTGTVKGNAIHFKTDKWYFGDEGGVYSWNKANTGTITLVDSKTIKLKTNSREDGFSDFKLLVPGGTVTLKYRTNI